jgi:hypothetical protein
LALGTGHWALLGTGTFILLSYVFIVLVSRLKSEGRTSDKQGVSATLKNKQNNHPIGANGSFMPKTRPTQQQRETSCE